MTAEEEEFVRMQRGVKSPTNIQPFLVSPLPTLENIDIHQFIWGEH